MLFEALLVDEDAVDVAVCVFDDVVDVELPDPDPELEPESDEPLSPEFPPSVAPVAAIRESTSDWVVQVTDVP